MFLHFLLHCTLLNSLICRCHSIILLSENGTYSDKHKSIHSQHMEKTMLRTYYGSISIRLFSQLFSACTIHTTVQWWLKKKMEVQSSKLERQRIVIPSDIKTLIKTFHILMLHIFNVFVFSNSRSSGFRYTSLFLMIDLDVKVNFSLFNCKH